MQKMFEAVQSQFISLGRLLESLDLKSDLDRPEILSQVNDALSDTYVLLNQGFCENVSACEKCAENRDQLGLLSRMIDGYEEQGNSKEDVHLALAEFTQNIPQILNKMKSVYSENIATAP